MAIYLIMILEGLLFLYTFLACRGFFPLLEIFHLSNNYLSMIKAVIAQFSIFFALLLLIAGGMMLYKRIKDADSVIDKDDVLPQMTGFLLFFGILLLIMFV